MHRDIYIYIEREIIHIYIYIYIYIHIYIYIYKFRGRHSAAKLRTSRPGSASQGPRVPQSTLPRSVLPSTYIYIYIYTQTILSGKRLPHVAKPFAFARYPAKAGFCQIIRQNPTIARSSGRYPAYIYIYIEIDREREI